MIQLDAKDKFHAAQEAFDEAQRNVEIAKNRLDKCYEGLKASLPISETYPCKVAVLPSGKLAVHFRTSNTSEIHICLPSFFNEDGTLRTAELGEKLGKKLYGGLYGQDIHSRRNLLSNLLALIHQDGGQYEHSYGIEKATEDAIEKIQKLRTQKR